ncbi:MAG: tRNA (guanine(46)-N(7))-methyltransferase TrmB [Kiloniellales bacterium]
MTDRRLGDRRRIVYGRRRGRRLRPGRQRLIDELLPGLEIRLPQHGRPLDPRGLFDPAVEAVWLELGFGAGEHLACQAKAHPTVGMIGCEPFVNGVAALLARIERERLQNVRIFADDGRDLIDVLPEASIGRVFVLFPDPWPKRRHGKRRVVSADSLAGLARVMADGAELRLASDVPEQVRSMLAQTLASRAFEWTARRPGDWRQRPSDWPPTRYELKALDEGRRSAYLSFRRRPRG